MRRRPFVIGSFALLATPLAAGAQQSGKIYRIGIVTLGGPEYKNHPILQAFRGRLQEMGYIDGENVTIEDRFASERAERLDSLAAELVRLNVDVIYAGGASPPALAAKRATNTIPIVFEGVGGPVENGLIKSLARPGGNATGTAITPCG
jgi:putative tryptophan/tyrosine transport system substrate-binding protein